VLEHSAKAYTSHSEILCSVPQVGVVWFILYVLSPEAWILHTGTLGGGSNRILANSA